MKKLVIGILIAAVVSVGYRVVGTFSADASALPAPEQQHARQEVEQKNPIQAVAVRVDRTTLERNIARDDTTGPDRTRRGNEASERSRAVPRSAAKPLNGELPFALATARTPPPVAPPAPPMVGPDGIVYRKLGSAPMVVSALRMTPPPADEPLVQAPPVAAEPEPEPATIVQDDKPLTHEPQPVPKEQRASVRGRMVGPDGIEYRTVQRGN